MALTVERSLIEENLTEFFKTHSENVYLLHADLGAWGILSGALKRKDLLSSYFELLSRASIGHSLIFPLFNYDYGRSRVYNVLKDKCQVGALNEFVRLQKPETRTQTPMFNFIEWPKVTFSLEPSLNPFGERSLWADFCKRNGRICFLGTGLSANTFVHHIEEIRGIGYRYLKPMPGKVVFKEEERNIEYIYRVRPQLSGVIDYNYVFLEDDLVHEHLLIRQSLGLGKLMSYNARKVMEYWLARLEDDEFYFLTDASKAKISELRRSKPYPFRFEDFEQEAEK